MLDEALSVQALAIPRYRLHSLKGKFKEYWSVTAPPLPRCSTASSITATF